MHAAEFFGKGPVEPEDAEVGDHGEVSDEVPVDVHARVMADPPAGVQANASMEGMGILMSRGLLLIR